MNIYAFGIGWLFNAVIMGVITNSWKAFLFNIGAGIVVFGILLLIKERQNINKELKLCLKKLSTLKFIRS